MPDGDPPPVQAGAKAVGFFTSLHFAAGCGGRQRRSPTGGAANGMPRYTVMPLWAVPSTWPPSMLTAPKATEDQSAPASSAPGLAPFPVFRCLIPFVSLPNRLDAGPTMYI